MFTDLPHSATIGMTLGLSEYVAVRYLSSLWLSHQRSWETDMPKVENKDSRGFGDCRLERSTFRLVLIGFSSNVASMRCGHDCGSSEDSIRGFRPDFEP